MLINIDRRSSLPVYEQVADQVRRSIASGRLEPGTPLPSVRQLARDLGVNLNTIARAYRLLQDEGFLIIRNRAGVSVARPASRPDRSKRKPLMEDLRTVLSRLRMAGLSKDELRRAAEREIEALGGDDDRRGKR